MCESLVKSILKQGILMIYFESYNSDSSRECFIFLYDVSYKQENDYTNYVCMLQLEQLQPGSIFSLPQLWNTSHTVHSPMLDKESMLGKTHKLCSKKNIIVNGEF